MSLSLNANFLLKPFIQFIVGKIIEAGTKMDPAKLVARATELIAVNTALTELNSGNTAGLPALQAAITSTSSLGLGEALALQSLSTAIANQVALLTSVAGSTLLGEGATAIMNGLLEAGTETAQAYVSKYLAEVVPPVPAAAPAAA